MGRNRSTVANLLRLLKLPAEVQTLVQEGSLSEGMPARCSPMEKESELAARGGGEGWSVRDIEARARGSASRGRARRAERPPAARGVTADAKRVEDALRKRFGTDVRVTARRRGRGFLTISYYSNDDLARVLELILGEPFAG